MFDVTHPEKGWTELNSCLGSYIPYIEGYDQLFVRLKFRDGDGDGDGEGFLMFSCDWKQPQTVQVFHMSHKCDSLKPMEPLQLPQFPPKFHGKLARCKFFHLGGQKVGLVFCRGSFKEYGYDDIDDDYMLRPESDDDDDDYDYRSPDDDDGDDDDDDNHDNRKDDDRDNYKDDDRDNYNDDGSGYNYDDVSDNGNGDGPDKIDMVKAALVIIFEYKIDKESMDIKYKLISTHCPEYSTKDPEEEAEEKVLTSQLIGAYVL